MKAFAELVGRFPFQVFDLLLEECFAERRPVFILDTYDIDFDCPCQWCERQSLYIFRGYDDTPLPNMDRELTCGSPQCVAAQTWFFDGPRGAGRRRQFTARFGFGVTQGEKPTNLTCALAMILESEGRRVANG